MTEDGRKEVLKVSKAGDKAEAVELAGGRDSRRGQGLVAEHPLVVP